MTAFICYIHVPDVPAPHLRIVEDSTEEAILATIDAAKREWPSFERIEVYDGNTDRPVLQFERLGQNSN